MKRLDIYLAYVQGVFYFITGVWPLIHIRSFEAITGAKTDDWLVQTVGVLVSATGMALLFAARRRTIPTSLALLAALQAFGLMCIDVVFVDAHVIRPIYLVDACVEALIVLMWMVCMLPQKVSRRSRYFSSHLP